MGLFTKAVAVLARGLGLTDPRLYAAIGEGPSDSGERITVSGALALDTVFACVRLRAETVGSLPFQLYRDVGTGRSSIDRNHWAYSIIHDQPYPGITSVDFWTAMAACELLWGNAYARKLRGSRDRIVGLFPMRPDCVHVRYDEGGVKSYVYNIDGRQEELPEDDVLHLKGFSVDGITGLTPITLNRQTLGNARAAERIEGSLYRNGMRPFGFFKAPQSVPDAQREKAKQAVAAYTGSMNAGKTFLLEGGWDYQTVNIPPADAQLLESRYLHVEQICRWYGVPPVLIGHTSKASTQAPGMEQQMLFFYQTCLRAQLSRIEKAVTAQLLSPAERKTYYAEFNIDGLLRADSEARMRAHASAVQNGLGTRNERRSLENLPPIDGGDILTVQSNLVPLHRLEELAMNKATRGSEPSMAPDLNATEPALTGANIPG